MEQESFPIFNFGDAIANLKVGHDIARNNLKETFDKMDNIYNIADMKNGIMKEIFN